MRLGNSISDSKHNAFTRPIQVIQSRGAKNMVGVNSLVVLCQILVFLLNSRTTTTNFATNGYGDIHFDEVVPEHDPTQTGPTEGEFLST